MATGTDTHLLVVDDDRSTREALERALGAEGYQVTTVDSAAAALEALRDPSIQLLITDVVLGGTSGIRLLEQVQRRLPWLPVIVCTGFATIESAVDAMRKGAADYLTKPVDLEALFLTVLRALHTSALARENERLRQELKTRHSFHGIVGRSPGLEAICERLPLVAATDVTALVRGESGTGKDLVVRAIHALSPRARKPFVVVDCAAIAESLVESELFGHERGAFTGAGARRRGKIERADGGTLFLDEIGDLAPHSQARLLRLLQEHTFVRVGGTERRSVDVRVVAATNRDLETMIQEGSFREDLYFRLNVVSLHLPPLRERREDIDLLVRGFLSDLAAKHRRRPLVLDRSARSRLLAYHWPGNVRELHNVCENLVVTVQADVVTARDLPTHVTGVGDAGVGRSLLDGTHPLGEIERCAILQALARCGGNKTRAAQTLGIGVKTLYRRLAEYDAG